MSAGMALRKQGIGWAWGTQSTWWGVCLAVFCFLQLQGVHCKCYFQAQAPCHHEGKRFTLGESWLRTDCFQCTCLHPVGVGCCDTSQHLIDFPGNCEVRRDPGTCRITLVQKSDPRLPCSGGPPDPEWGSAGTSEPGIPSAPRDPTDRHLRPTA
ncbi:prostate-associated microseminoprotein [Ornithorhynchus anatinus]|uniref:prostate-associated microseminoprotein n=1 Tax=Ornithorhynchus anatinus TaxID=9258 RepID=UPI0010A892FA|nr:prostate-associated microseminoprotein [Ornithorhynchus anatinus]